MFTNHDVSNFTEYRKKEQSLSRILLIVDEFQVLFQQSDAVTAKVNALLGDILARGRSAGIHLLLATQSVKALASVTGFAGVKERLVSRIALASSRDDSEYILGTPGCGNYAADELRRENTDDMRYGILNTEGGYKEGNTKFLIPFPTRDKCDKHQMFLAEQYGTMPKEIKVFNGNELPSLPAPQWFSDYSRQIVLGEQFNFEAAPFAFQWERRMGNNLCVAGINEIIRQGILHSMLSSIRHGNHHFDRVIYYNSGNCPAINLLGFGVETKDQDWDCNIEELTNDLRHQQTLLIIDSLDSARPFHPPAYSTGGAKPASPADSLKILLDQGPQNGSFVLAFVDNWKRFNTTCRDYIRNFEMYIGFQLNEEDVSALVAGREKGFDKPNKAIFVDRQQSVKTVFRPFVVR